MMCNQIYKCFVVLSLLRDVKEISYLEKYSKKILLV